MHGNLFTFAINTITSLTYQIEFKTNLNDSAWQLLQFLAGNGSRQTVGIPVQPANQSFFRFQVQ